MTGTIDAVARKMTAFRLTEDARIRLRLLAKRLGVSQATVIEIAVRRLDEVDLPVPPPPEKEPPHDAE